MVPQLVGIAIVFGLLAVWALAMRRGGHLRWLEPFLRSAPPHSNLLQGVASLNLTPQHRLHVVAYQQRQFLVLTGPGVGAIHDCDAPPPFISAFNAALAPKESDR